MKVYNYDERITADNLNLFLEEFRDNCVMCDRDLSNKDTIPVLLSFLREQFIFAKIEQSHEIIPSEKLERVDYSTVENLIVLYKNLTSNHEFSDCEIHDFYSDFRKFYFWFIQYVEVAEIYSRTRNANNDKISDIAA